MSNEDKMREAFSVWWEEHGQFCRAGGGHYEETFAYESWKACAAIKDAEIASSDLMIKDLREALIGFMGNPNFDGEPFRKGAEALANSEHHNSRALDKIILQAKIDALDEVNGLESWTIDVATSDYANKLAELNKE